MSNDGGAGLSSAFYYAFLPYNNAADAPVTLHDQG